jgi:hypothetical protein
MESKVSPLTLWVEPSVNSSIAFLAVVAFVCAAWLLAIRRAWPNESARPLTITGAGLALMLTLTAVGAETGFLASLTQSPAIALYLGGSNVLVLILALSPVGARIAQHVPIGWIVVYQAFRLPLELVLHSWYEQGVLPIQMTYEGMNLDIITGILALILGPLLPRLNARARYWATAGFSLVGLGLLLNVGQVAVRSTPSPLRTFSNDPPVLLAFHAPYTWIVPVCVSGALFGHVLVIRWLLSQAKLGVGKPHAHGATLS